MEKSYFWLDPNTDITYIFDNGSWVEFSDVEGEIQ